MQRRQVIKQLYCLTGAALVVPSCMQNDGSPSISLKNIVINGNQEKLIAALAEHIIPATDTPGAKDVAAHLFTLMMVDDCFSKEDRQKFIRGLKAFEINAGKQFNKSFANCTASEKDLLLKELEAGKTSDELTYFYDAVKKLTVQAYTSSKFFLTKIQVYQLVPGNYYGCVPVKNIS